MGTTPAKRPKQSITTKSLCQIPSRFAIEMSNRGWILRNEIIWKKPNCMPASVTDRFTVDFEKVFFFTKRKKYFFDAESVAEPITDTSALRLLQDIDSQNGSNRANGGNKTNGNMKAVGRKPFSTSMGGGGTTFNGHSGYRKADGRLLIRPTRNKRAVWTVPTAGFKEAHFAVFPEALIKPMVLASCPEEVCTSCGKPRVRIVRKSSNYINRERAHQPNNTPTKVDSTGWKPPSIEHKGWTDCGCNAGFSKGIVLDPFFGSGTTGLVAKNLNRGYIGIELNSDYIKIAEKRLRQEVLL